MFLGIASGIVNGLIGTGGGILLVFGLSPLFSDKRDVFANALAVMFPSTVISVIFYLASGRIGISDFGIYAVPAAAGGLAGAFLLDRLDPKLLKKLFAVIVIWSGVYMIMRSFS